jgi:redox-sensitive bicupin YhaK (pirin superfamily)
MVYCRIRYTEVVFQTHPQEPHMSAIEHLLKPHVRDIGEFTVRRLLPAATTQTVGPFIFFDHMGPVEMEPGAGMDVRPHPHIGLATVTYLFEGEIMHRDSLGSEQVIRPGDVNWMTAGRGITHSERSPDGARSAGPPAASRPGWRCRRRMRMIRLRSTTIRAPRCPSSNCRACG